MGSITKRLRRQNAGEIRRKAVMRTVSVMEEETRKRLTDAYEVGFNEGSATAHIVMAVIALAAARGRFGFGRKRLQRLATEIEELTELINSGKLTVGEILTMLQNERISFLDRLVVTDGEGREHVITPESIVAKEKKALGGISVA